jgi:hypothetical protein
VKVNKGYVLPQEVVRMCIDMFKKQRHNRKFARKFHALHWTAVGAYLKRESVKEEKRKEKKEFHGEREYKLGSGCEGEGKRKEKKIDTDKLMAPVD